MAVIEYATGTVRVQETTHDIVRKWHGDIAILTKVRDGEKIAVNLRNFMWIEDEKKPRQRMVMENA